MFGLKDRRTSLLVITLSDSSQLPTYDSVFGDFSREKPNA
jgi:hypothetical protein